MVSAGPGAPGLVDRCSLRLRQQPPPPVPPVPHRKINTLRILLLTVIHKEAAEVHGGKAELRTCNLNPVVHFRCSSTDLRYLFVNTRRVLVPLW